MNELLVSIILLAHGVVSPTHEQFCLNKPCNIMDDLNEDNRQWMDMSCINATRTQKNLNLCTQRKARYSGQRLNNFLTEVQQVLGSTDELWLELEKRHKEWEQLREQQCFWEKAFFGVGSIAPMIYHNCIAFCNIWRIQTIKRFLCEGYGMNRYCDNVYRFSGK